MLAYMIGIAQSANDYIQIAYTKCFHRLNFGVVKMAPISIVWSRFLVENLLLTKLWQKFTGGFFAGDSIDIHDITPSLTELIELNIVFSVWIWYRWIELAELFPKMVKSLQTGWWLQRYHPKWEEKHRKALMVPANAPNKTKGWEKDKQSKYLRKNTKKINGQVIIVIHSNSYVQYPCIYQFLLVSFPYMCRILPECIPGHLPILQNTTLVHYYSTMDGSYNLQNIILYLNHALIGGMLGFRQFIPIFGVLALLMLEIWEIFGGFVGWHWQWKHQYNPTCSPVDWYNLDKSRFLRLRVT